MENENIAPIRHSVFSSAGSTAAGAVGGGVKTGLKTYLYTTLACAAIAAGIAVIAVTGGSILGAVGTLGTFSNVLANAAGWGLAGGLVGGTLIAPFTGALGALFGVAKGGANAADRVRQEKGAANMLDAQLSAYQAQAMASQANTNIYAPSATNDNKYSFPSQGSAMNAAMPQIQADSAQGMGTLNGRNLQIA